MLQPSRPSPPVRPQTCPRFGAGLRQVTEAVSDPDLARRRAESAFVGERCGRFAIAARCAEFGVAPAPASGRRVSGDADLLQAAP